MQIFLDWIAREGWLILSWWVLATLAGVAALPYCWRFLSALPSRGIFTARALGMLLVGFVYWMLNTLGFLQNNPGSLVLAWGLVLVGGVLILRNAPDLGDPAQQADYWTRHRAGIIIGELVFAAFFIGWVIVRAYQNNLVTTEKPMDLAFTAASLYSPTLPPQDPWLAGFSISYYYFGYVLAAGMSMLSGVRAAIGYNLWTAMLAALTALTAFGVVYDLVRWRVSAARAAVPAAVLGAIMVALMGNFQTALVDAPYFNRTASDGYLQFWDVRERQTPLPELVPGQVATWEYWWWFRSARVLHDRNLPAQGEGREEVINEFPSFSYLLADNHPHVMALPFALVAMSLILSVALARMTPSTWHALFFGVSVGALIFLNTWDAPIYLGLLVSAEALRAWHANGGRWHATDSWTLLAFGGILAGTAAIAYLPFLISFSSQLGGALPNLFYPTRFRQILLTFGALIPLAGLFVGVEAWRGGRKLNWRAGLTGGLGIFGLILLAFVLLTVLGAVNPQWRGGNQQLLIDNPDAIGQTLSRRLEYILTTVLLVAGLVLIFARLFSVQHDLKKPTDANRISYPLQTGVALMFVAAAFVLVLVPEYIYLRDGFGQRMNTVFKFYYQAWALLGIAGAYGLHSVLADTTLKIPARAVRGVIGAGAVIAVGLGMVYPLTAIPERMFGETGRGSDSNTNPLTLDGAVTLTTRGDYEALVCLRDLTAGQTGLVVAEVSFGGGYDYFNGGIASGRVTGITGLPVVIGWQGHQRQWRGRGYDTAVGSRPQDIEQLYRDLRLDVVQIIIDRYSIDYIVFGPAERMRYGADGELKFLDSFEIVCQSEETRVYRAVGLAGISSAGVRP